MTHPKPLAIDHAAVLAPLRLLREQRLPDAPVPPTPPLITVVVCAYRHAAYIDECLASVNATAPGTSIELIVIDDGSPDDTLARCLAFGFRADLPLRVYTKPNHGLVHTLQCALALAEGRYFAVMASDDCYVAGGLEQAQAALESAPALGGLLCQAVYLAEGEGDRMYGAALEALFQDTPAARLEAVCTEVPKPLLLQSSVFQTQLLREVGVWHDGLELDDWPAFIHVFMAEAAGRTAVRYRSDIVLCGYRNHAEGVHNRLDRQLRLTEQVARELVPARYRSVCLANVRIDIGLIHLYSGSSAHGLWLCLRGLLTAPTSRVIGRVWRRATQALSRRFRPIALVNAKGG